MKHVTNEGESEVPDGWRCHSMNVVSVPHANGAVDLTIVRIPTQASELEAAVEEHVNNLRRKLPRFQQAHRRATAIGAVPAVDFAVRYATADGERYRRSALSLLDGSLLVMAVAAAPSNATGVDETFERATATARWHQESP